MAAEWDLIDYMKVVGLLTAITVTIKLLFFRDDQVKYAGHYTKPGKRQCNKKVQSLTLEKVLSQFNNSNSEKRSLKNPEINLNSVQCRRPVH
jgi:hypothetical protein